MVITNDAGCNVCGSQRSKLLRCSICKQTYYCSVLCQKLDWKQGHKRACRSWAELHRSLASASKEDLEHDYHAAERAIYEMGAKNGSRNSTQLAPDNRGENLLQDTAPSQRTLPLRDGIDLPQYSCPQRVISLSHWKLCIEDMPQLGCLQVTLSANPSHLARPIDLSKLCVSTQEIDTEKTLVYFAYDDIPDRIQCTVPRSLIKSACRAYVIDNGSAFSIRLGYHRCSDVDYYEPAQLSIQPADAKQLGCKICGAGILTTSSAPIQSVLPLPSHGRWDDMQDYLVCYEGQAFFDFSKVTSSEYVLLENETLLVVHASIATTCSLCFMHGDSEEHGSTSSSAMLAIDGSALVRGPRPWHHGGSIEGDCTVTCWQCAQPLGYEMEGSYRLFKHQLVLTATEKEDIPVQRISTFLGYELVRYAETKAIFTFAVRSTQGSSCVIVRLVSWDSFSAVSPSGKSIAASMIDCTQQWYRTAKVLFAVEEEASRGGLHHNKNESATDVWLWTRADWCCPPTDGAPSLGEGEVAKGGGASVVELNLEQFEWDQLVTELKDGMELIPKETSIATISAKLGTDGATMESTNLSAILLT